MQLRWMMLQIPNLAGPDGTGPATPDLLHRLIWPADPQITVEDVIMQLLTLDELGGIAVYSAAAADRFWLPPPLRNIPVTHGNGEEGEEEGGGGGGGRREPGARPASPHTPLADFEDDLPPRWCPLHPGGTYEPCGGCATARTERAYELTRRRKAVLAALADNPASSTP